VSAEPTVPASSVYALQYSNPADMYMTGTPANQATWLGRWTFKIVAQFGTYGTIDSDNFLIVINDPCLDTALQGAATLTKFVTSVKLGSEVYRDFNTYDDSASSTYGSGVCGTQSYSFSITPEPTASTPDLLTLTGQRFSMITDLDAHINTYSVDLTISLDSYQNITKVVSMEVEVVQCVVTSI